MFVLTINVNFCSRRTGRMTLSYLFITNFLIRKLVHVALRHTLARNQPWQWLCLIFTVERLPYCCNKFLFILMRSLVTSLTKIDLYLLKVLLEYFTNWDLKKTYVLCIVELYKKHLGIFKNTWEVPTARASLRTSLEVLNWEHRCQCFWWVWWCIR